MRVIPSAVEGLRQASLEKPRDPSTALGMTLKSIAVAE